MEEILQASSGLIHGWHICAINTFALTSHEFHCYKRLSPGSVCPLQMANYGTMSSNWNAMHYKYRNPNVKKVILTWRLPTTVLCKNVFYFRTKKEKSIYPKNATISPLFNIMLLIPPIFPLSFFSLLPVLLSPPAPKTAAWLTHPSPGYKAPANTYWLNHKEERNEEMTEHTALCPRRAIK